MTETSEVVTEIMVTALPPDHDEAAMFAVWVQWRGDDRYAVSRWSQSSANRVLDADGVWVWEPRPSEREEDVIALTRFGRDTALRMAHEAAPRVTVNGWTPAKVLERGAALASAGGEA